MTDFVLYIQKSSQQHITFTNILHSIYRQLTPCILHKIFNTLQGNPKFGKLEFH